MKKRTLTASSETIHFNILRLFQTKQKAHKRTGISRRTFDYLISDGEITDCVAGKLYKLGYDPAELVKPMPKTLRG